jgi:hypothetical protein
LRNKFWVSSIAATVLSAAASLPGVAQDAASCDYFRNSLIGTKCAQTIGIGISGSAENFRTSYNYVGGQGRSESRFSSLAGHLSFTPLHWLTITGSSSYDWSSHNYIDTDDFFGTTTASSKYAAVGFQTIGANANIFDSGKGSSRYVLNAHGWFGWRPASDRNNGGHGYHGGLTGSAQWQVGGGYSLNGRLGLTGHTFSESDYSVWTSSARLLLAHDAAGIAFGPRFSSNYRDVSGLNISANRSAYSNELGAMVLATPFRSSNSALLAGLVVQANYDHSLGQAAWFSDRSVATSSTISGSAMFHFKY